MIYLDVPKAPTLLHTEDIEATQLTLYWVLDELNGSTDSVIIEHKKLFEYEWVRLEIFQSITSYTVLHLEENTVYQFRIQAKNKAGLSVYSQVLNFKTRDTIRQIAGL